MPSDLRPYRLAALVDGGAVVLSGLCLLHCLALPLLLALLPVFAAGVVGDERFHRWMLLAVVPSSALALASGWRRHRQWRLAFAAAAAVALMAFAAFGGGARYGERGETVLTVAGGLVLAFVHAANVRLGRRHSHRCAADSIMGAPDG
ncbi:MAG: MerC domain-containing protein [Solimonas sp.]